MGEAGPGTQTVRAPELSMSMCCDVEKGWEALLRRILLPGSLRIGVRKEVRLTRHVGLELLSKETPRSGAK